MIIMTGARVAMLREQGFLHVPGFLTPGEVAALKARALALSQELLASGVQGAFSTGGERDDRWFLDSGDAVRGFLEPGSTTALNKIGHALHAHEPLVEGLARASDLLRVAWAWGHSLPCVVQSMLIFKSPGVGGAVDWHTDHTFLWTEPASVLGFWIALDDAGPDNGRLEVIPGGHREPVRRRFVREGDRTRFEVLSEAPFREADAIGISAKAGDLVVLDGRLPHRSLANRSTRPRLALTLHAVDAEARWASSNWLEPAWVPMVEA